MNLSSSSRRINWAETGLLFGLILFVLATPVLFNPKDEVLAWHQVWSRWGLLAPYVVLFLINHYLLLPYLFFRNRKIPYIITCLVLIFGITLFSWNGQPELRKMGPRQAEAMKNSQNGPLDPKREQVQNRTQGSKPPNPAAPPFPPFINTTLMSILVIGFGTGLRTSFRWVKIEQDHVELEKENVKNRLAMLKHQVSPHFFMNTLNNLHALIDVDQEMAKEAVIKLSKMMRHLLHEPASGKIALQEEINFLSHYIDLMRLRYSEKVKIKVDMPTQVPNITIPPLLFTSLIENAFKHGVSYKSPSFIHISLRIQNDQLELEIENSNHDQQSPENTGIGIRNTKDRLDLLYGPNYTMDVDDGHEAFTIKLSIPL